MGNTTRGKNDSRPWTSNELVELRRLAHLGAHEIAEILDRSVKSVRRTAERHRISLRRNGERRGALLGIPRVDADDLRAAGLEVAVLHEIRRLALAGTVDPATLEARAIRSLTDSTLCPQCVRRPAEVRRSGLCRPCHLRHLAEAHADELEAHAAQRDLWAARQRKQRATKGAAL